MSTSLTAEEVDGIIQGRHQTPYSVMGQHATELAGSSVVRSFQPKASSAILLAEDGRQLSMSRIHEDGLFELQLDKAAGPYRLKLSDGDNEWEVIDPYSMPSALGDVDRHLFNEGTHQKLYEVLGSHVCTLEGVQGVSFCVWAPNATRVSVVGSFNHWDGRCHLMRANPGSGLWDIFIPQLGDGTLYKYEIVDANHQLLPLKHDPFGAYFEQAPDNAAIVFDSQFIWTDEDYLKRYRHRDMRSEPMSRIG